MNLPPPIKSWTIVRMGDYRWFQSPEHNELRFNTDGSIEFGVAGDRARMGMLLLTEEDLTWITEMRLWLLTQKDAVKRKKS